jgi:hypothetical protein
VSGQEDEIEIGLKSETGELFTLDKGERKLLRAVLSVALSYERTRSVIAKKLGEESLAVAENLLREMGGKLE